MKTWDEVVEGYRERWIESFSQGVEGFSEQACREIVTALEQKTGKWIYCEDEDAQCVDGYRCDQCGFFAPWDYEHKSPYFIEEYLYCPSCGSRMKGENDE